MSNLEINTDGIHHLGLTVKDIEQTTEFFCNVLNFKIVGGNPNYPAHFVSDGTVMITIWQVKETNAQEFNRKKNIGLHHFALKVRNNEALESLHNRLAEVSGVDIEFPPEPLGNLTIKHMMCVIPGGIRVEFIAA